MKPTRTRRRMLQVLGAGAALGIAGCSALSKDADAGTTTTTTDVGTPAAPETPTGTTTTESTTTTETTETTEEETTTEPVEAPSGTFEGLSVPADAGSATYAVLGSADAPVKATLYGGWKCSYTQRFVNERIEDLVLADYVETGDVLLEFRAVPYRDGEPWHGPDEPHAAHFGLAVWNNDPESFWSYFEYAYANMSQRDGWASTDRLARIAKEAGVNKLDAIREKADAEPYGDEIDATMKKVGDIPVSALPRIVVDGEATAPTAHPDQTTAQLDEAVENAG